MLWYKFTNQTSLYMEANTRASSLLWWKPLAPWRSPLSPITPTSALSESNGLMVYNDSVFTALFILMTSKFVQL